MSGRYKFVGGQIRFLPTSGATKTHYHNMYDKQTQQPVYYKHTEPCPLCEAIEAIKRKGVPWYKRIWNWGKSIVGRFA